MIHRTTTPKFNSPPKTNFILQESMKPRKRYAKKQNGYLRRPYKQLRKEEKQRAKEKRKDIPI